MELRFWRYDLQLAHRWMVASSQAKGGKMVYPAVMLELRDADGMIGRGESAPSLRYNESATTAFEFMQQIDGARLSFDDVEGSMRYVEALTPGNYSPKGAINLALLDGAAKKTGQPLHGFLGLSFTEGKHVSSISIGIDAPEVIREKTREAIAYRVLKLKVGAPNDRENLAAVREVAPDKTIRVDANEAWLTKEEALRHIEEIARHPGVEFIEQPMPATNPPNDFIWLKERSPLLIVGDESYMNAADVNLCADCFHGVNIKLAKTGGISRGIEALQAARAAGLKTMIGSMVESSILTSAGAHLASLADWLDLDGMLLITNDPYRGVVAPHGVMSFSEAPEPYGLRVGPR
ncbi:MAG: dipeptide epimerase [Verrucomicrobiota bacterium]|nr:dipeptide epimerase [Verrucomicrobiota bacterium]